MAASVTAIIGIGDSVSASTTLETGTLTPTGSNKAIYVLVGSGATSPNDPSVVKYASTGGSGGETFTKLDSTRTIATNVKQSIYRLASPSAASGTIHCTWAGSDDERWIIAVAVQDAAGTEGTIAYATGNSTTPSVAATSTSGELVIDFMSLLDISAYSPTMTVGAGQTSNKQLQGATPSGGSANNISPYEEAASSRETASGSSTTMSYTLSAVIDGWGIHAFQVNPSGGGGGSPLRRNSQLNGLGASGPFFHNPLG